MRSARTLIFTATLLFTTPLIATETTTVPTPSPSLGDASERSFCARVGGEIFAQTELYFGLSRASEPNVSEAEFQLFVDTIVTPRFPDGLTVLDGKGQFRNASGDVIQEPAKVLVLLYPFSTQKHRAVDRIREIYKRTFQQQSVLRVDEVTCVSF